MFAPNKIIEYMAQFVVLLSLCSCTLVKMLSFTWKM